MTYRPPEWKKIKEERWGDIGLASGIFKDREIEFEAGADAMSPYAYDKGKVEGKKELLEALLAKPSSRRVKQYHEYFGDKAVNGTWVFIPDNEVKK